MRPEPIPGVEYLRTEDPRLVDAANRLQYEVFSEFGYKGPGPHIVEVEELPSIYYIAVLEDEVIGCVRIVGKSPLGFTATSWMKLSPEWEEEAKRIAGEEPSEEILFSTVKRGFRTRGKASVILNLYGLLFRDALKRGTEYWFTAIDAKLFPYFTAVFNFKFEPMGEAQDYLGAPTIPTVINLTHGLEQLERADPELAQFITT